MYYILENRKVRKADAENYAGWMLNHFKERRIGNDRLDNTILVNTIFTGLDYSAGMEKKPMVFLTRVSIKDPYYKILESRVHKDWRSAEKFHAEMISKWEKWKR